MSEETNQNKVKSESEKAESTNSKFAVPQAAIQKLADLAKLIPQELSAPARGVLFILIIAAILLLGFGVYMGWSKNPISCLIAFLATLFLLLIAMLYFLGMKQLAQHKSSGHLVWPGSCLFCISGQSFLKYPAPVLYIPGGCF